MHASYGGEMVYVHVHVLVASHDTIIFKSDRRWWIFPCRIKIHAL